MFLSFGRMEDRTRHGKVEINSLWFVKDSFKLVILLRQNLICLLIVDLLISYNHTKRNISKISWKHLVEYTLVMSSNIRTRLTLTVSAPFGYRSHESTQKWYVKTLCEQNSGRRGKRFQCSSHYWQKFSPQTSRVSEIHHSQFPSIPTIGKHNLTILKKM